MKTDRGSLAAAAEKARCCLIKLSTDYTGLELVGVIEGAVAAECIERLGLAPCRDKQCNDRMGDTGHAHLDESAFGEAKRYSPEDEMPLSARYREIKMPGLSAVRWNFYSRGQNMPILYFTRLPLLKRFKRQGKQVGDASRSS